MMRFVFPVLQTELPSGVYSQLIWIDTGKTLWLAGMWPVDYVPMLVVVILDEVVY
jgi:hypothetical protein